MCKYSKHVKVVNKKNNKFVQMYIEYEHPGQSLKLRKQNIYLAESVDASIGIQNTVRMGESLTC